VPSDKVIESYKQKKSKSKITQHFFHAPYLINLASDDKKYLKASVELLVSYQQLAYEIGAVGTIFHIGSYKDSGFESKAGQIATSINYILDSSPRGTKLIIENTVNYTLAQLRDIIDRVGDKPKIGVCLDTQHAFAAGIPLAKLLDQFGHEVGLKYLSAIHLNDSKTDFGSGVDRHENLGVGKIGKLEIKKFIENCKLKIKNCPLILEVPGAGDGPRKQDVDFLKKMIS
jgi:deoxyribonuclease-4